MELLPTTKRLRRPHVGDLKVLLAASGMAVSGKKDDLIARLAASRSLSSSSPPPPQSLLSYAEACANAHDGFPEASNAQYYITYVLDGAETLGRGGNEIKRSTDVESTN